MIRITDGKGFQITFANGYTVSVQFGHGNYCQNRHTKDQQSQIGENGSEDAECAVWGKDGVMIDPMGEWGSTVNGWMSPKEVLDLLNWAEKQGVVK